MSQGNKRVRPMQQEKKARKTACESDKMLDLTEKDFKVITVDMFIGPWWPQLSP